MSFPESAWRTVHPDSEVDGGGDSTTYTDYAAARTDLEALAGAERDAARFKLVNKTNPLLHICTLAWSAALGRAIPVGPILSDNVTDSAFEEVATPSVGASVFVDVADGTTFAIGDMVTHYDKSAGTYDPDLEIVDIVGDVLELDTAISTDTEDLIMVQGVSEIAAEGATRYLEASAGGVAYFAGGIVSIGCFAPLLFWPRTYAANQDREIIFSARRFELQNSGGGNDTMIGMGWRMTNETKRFVMGARVTSGSWRVGGERNGLAQNGGALSRAVDASDEVSLLLVASGISSTLGSHSVMLTDVNGVGLGGGVLIDASESFTSFLDLDWGPFFFFAVPVGGGTVAAIVKEFELSLV